MYDVAIDRDYECVPICWAKIANLKIYITKVKDLNDNFFFLPLNWIKFSSVNCFAGNKKKNSESVSTRLKNFT